MNTRNPVYHTPLPQGTTLLNGQLVLDAHNGASDAHAGKLLPLSGGNLTGPVTVPKATAVNQVAPITKRDSTVGVLEINGFPLVHTPEQIIVSWTGGVQDVANQLGTIDTAQYTINGTGSIRLQRIGPMVRLSFPDQSSNSLAKVSSGPRYLFTAGSSAAGLPSGYRTITAGLIDGRSTAGPVTWTATATGGALRFDSTVGLSLDRLALQWFTSDPPPTAIVGVAVSGTGVSI